jgi:acyl carrier protein
MVPAAFVFLAELPLTPNGKVNRRALPEPDWRAPQAETASEGPRNAMETIIAGIWADVLHVEEVGIADDFFALGGHSLLATQVIARIRRVLQAELPLRALFETPTVAGLASALLDGPHSDPAVRLRAEGLLRETGPAGSSQG